MFVIGAGLVGYKMYNPDFFKKKDPLESILENGEFVDKMKQEIQLKIDSINETKAQQSDKKQSN